MAKFKTLSFCQKVFYGIKLIHASVQYVYIVYAKYQMASEKALAQIDFPVHALSERWQNPYQEAKYKKWLSSKRCHVVKKYFLWHQTFSWVCPLRLHTVKNG